MKNRLLLYLNLLIFFLTVKVEAEDPSLHLADPYFLNPNSVFLGFLFENMGLKDGSLNLYELLVEYGVNENVLINLYFPYFTLLDADDGGCFGDVTASIKLSLAQYEFLNTRILSEISFQFPTGVIREEATRDVNGYNLSYYPFTTGSPAFSPSIMGTILIDQLVMSAVLIYQSVNDSTESIFDFNMQHDRIDFQLSADYLFKFVLFDSVHLYIRPVIYADYKYNLSNSPIIPTGFYMTFENNIKIENLWRIKIYYSIPIMTDYTVDSYTVALQLGRYF